MEQLGTFKKSQLSGIVIQDTTGHTWDVCSPHDYVMRRLLIYNPSKRIDSTMFSNENELS